jgi:predicted nucleic acid binding AN1-type Zn finger protein
MPAKKRCQFHGEQQCNQAALRIIGNCPHCRSDFCGTVRIVFFCWAYAQISKVTGVLQHRLPEHHACNNLEDCRQQAFNRNKLKLESERTVAPKLATA